jgi:hypothetical protein
MPLPTYESGVFFHLSQCIVIDDDNSINRTYFWVIASKSMLHSSTQPSAAHVAPEGHARAIFDQVG